MESYWSLKGRIQASTPVHHSATQGDRDREDAAKRVTNVSLKPTGRKLTLEGFRLVRDGRRRAASASMSPATLGVKPGRDRILSNDNAIVDRPRCPNSLRSPRSSNPNRTERTQGDD